MKTEIKINVRGYIVQLRDNRTGALQEDGIFLTKEMLQAAQLLGMSDRNVIHSRYDRKGFEVLEISKARKAECTVDLADLVLREEQSIVWDELADSCTEGLEIAQEYRKLEAQMDALLEEARELLRDQARRNVDELTEEDSFDAE